MVISTEAAVRFDIPSGMHPGWGGTRPEIHGRLWTGSANSAPGTYFIPCFAIRA
jgi:hypothetical protein